MPAEYYKVGDRVTVTLPGGEKTGKIKRKLENYAWTGETKYGVTGLGMETITSARMIRRER